MRGVSPTADDRSERTGIDKILFGHDEVAALEEGGNGTAQQQRPQQAVEHQEELERRRAQQVAQLVLELIAHRLKHKREQDNHPQPVSPAEARTIEQRERGKECTAERHKCGERQFPLPACGVHYQSTTFGRPSQ